MSIVCFDCAPMCKGIEASPTHLAWLDKINKIERNGNQREWRIYCACCHKVIDVWRGRRFDIALANPPTPTPIKVPKRRPKHVGRRYQLALATATPKGEPHATENSRAAGQSRI